MKDDGEGFTLAQADDDDGDGDDDVEADRRERVFSSLDSNESHPESNFNFIGIPTEKKSRSRFLLPRNSSRTRSSSGGCQTSDSFDQSRTFGEEFLIKIYCWVSFLFVFLPIRFVAFPAKEELSELFRRLFWRQK